MHLRQSFKRLGIVSTIAGTMLALCFIAYNAQSSCEPAVEVHSIDAGGSRAAGSNPHPGSGPHQKPWLKIVVTHVILIAGKLAAS